MTFDYAPLYVKIREELKAEIRSGRYKPHDRCLSESEIKARYRVSDTTAKKAMSELVREGYLYRRQGKGSFVAPVSEAGSEPVVYVLTPDIAGHMCPLILKGVEAALRGERYTLSIRISDTSPENAGPLVQRLTDTQTAGMIVIANGPMTFALETFGAASDKGLVIVNRYFEDPRYGDCVLSDDFDGARDATRRLLELGHRRVLHLALPTENSVPAFARIQGYRQAFADAGVPFFDGDVLEVRGRGESAREIVLTRLASGPPFTAIFAATDYHAFWANRALVEKGLRVPDDVSLIGFGDLEDISAAFTPPLTTVHQPFCEMGAKAGELLLRQIRGKRRPVEGKVLLPVKLIERASTRAVGKS